MSKSIRDKYFDNEIFNIGDIVESVDTGEKIKILDRGANYVTVAIGNSISKKWLNEIREETVVEDKPTSPIDFVLLESGQIKMFGHETLNFDKDLSELVLEQFSRFDDLYSKHQIVKCLDYAIGDTDSDRAYELLEKVESFYSKKEEDTPFIVEALKTDIERRRLVEIIAAIAEIRPSKTNYQTVTQSIKALKAKYTSRKQWEVLWPLFKLAMAAGLDGILQQIPYNFSAPSDNDQNVKESMEDQVVYAALEEHLDELVEDLDEDDILMTFEEVEFSDELITEVLSIEARNKLSRKMSQHSDVIAAKRVRALSRAATPTVLLARARRLAETMVKRKLFHKAPGEMNRQEKERFEAGATGRRALIAKLAQRLVGKVRAIQSQRAHHDHAAPVTHSAHSTNSAIGAS